MAYTIPTTEPTEAQIGSSWFWDRTYADFPADDGWELSYYLRGASDQDFAFGDQITAAPSGPAFEVRIPASDTDVITESGGYRLIGRVENAGEVHVVYDAHLLVLADPSTAVNEKSHARTMLEALQTARQNAASGSNKIQVQVNGRSITYARRELDDEIARFELLVALEENPHGTITHAAEFVRG